MTKGHGLIFYCVSSLLEITEARKAEGNLGHPVDRYGNVRLPLAFPWKDERPGVSINLAVSSSSAIRQIRRTSRRYYRIISYPGLKPGAINMPSLRDSNDNLATMEFFFII